MFRNDSKKPSRDKLIRWCFGFPLPIEDAEKVLEAMHSTEEGRDAVIIGSVTDSYPGKLVMETNYGGRRVLQKLTGAQLPRIC